MFNLTDTLILHVWWRYDARQNPPFDLVYSTFNVIEGLVWMAVAVAVLRRYSVNRVSRIELLYAGTFLLFGLTDFREAFEQSSWLIGLKLVILMALWRLRRTVMSRCYPSARAF